MADGNQNLPAPFGKYLLTQMIAVGGMAEVYRAKIFGASGFEKEMVVKRILPKYAQNPNFVQMLIDEAKIAVSLTHGNIVPIYELGEYEGSYYIAMEYVEGRTVLDVLRDAHSKRHPLPYAHCLYVAAEVARGLAYAHTRKSPDGQPLGLVHRDINPRNIVISPSGEVKILDFGIARASNKRHQTASGVIKGTPGYMSPEQMYGKAVDARSDIYCLGILVFELLTLRRLFPVWDVSEMRQVFEAGPVPTPSSILPSLSPEVDRVIMKALSEDVSQRYQSAADFEEDLRTVIAQSGVAVTSSNLAREVKAIDDADGLPAPRTAPPVVDTPRAPPPPPKGLGPPPPIRQPVSPNARTETAAVPSPTARPSHVPQASPRTEPMPVPDKPASRIDAEHSFVISLAPDGPKPQAPTVPLPRVSMNEASQGLRTQVLAKNDSVKWAGQIGDDAELLALMKATGSTPGAGKRTLLIAAALVVVGIGVAFAFAGNEIVATVQRALAGQKAEPGVVVVKTVPSGAEVLIDGKAKGKTNLKIAGIDINTPHDLEVRLAGQPPILVQIVKEKFQPGDGNQPTFVFEFDSVLEKKKVEEGKQ